MKRIFFQICVASAAALFAGSARSQTFNPTCSPSGATPPCDDVTTSLGVFKIKVNDAFVPLVSGLPGWNAAAKTLTTPTLYDPASTIGRSVVITDAGAGSTDAVGVVAGSHPINVVADGGLVLPPVLAGPVTGTREIHTEVESINLTHSSGVAVRIGLWNPSRGGLPHSQGTVYSNSGNSGNSALDFPASSFFDIFAQIDIPGLAGATAILGNASSLMLSSTSVSGLPPHVVYTLDGSNWVPIFFMNANTSQWNQGDFFGFLLMAGHGTGYKVLTGAGGAPVLDVNGNYQNDPANNDLNSFTAFMGTVADATTHLFTVANRSDSGAGSLRQAILDSNAAGGPANIVVAAGLTGFIGPANALPGIANPTFLTGNRVTDITVTGGLFGGPQTGIFTINPGPGKVAAIANLTMEGGIAPAGNGGAIHVLTGGVTAFNDSFIVNSAQNGGAIAIEAQGFANIFGCNLSGSATVNGGAVWGHNATVTIQISTLGGGANDGGAGYFDAGSHVSIIASTVANGQANDRGAGLVISGNGTYGLVAATGFNRDVVQQNGAGGIDLVSTNGASVNATQITALGGTGPQQAIVADPGSSLLLSDSVVSSVSNNIAPTSSIVGQTADALQIVTTSAAYGSFWTPAGNGVPFYWPFPGSAACNGTYGPPGFAYDLRGVVTASSDLAVPGTINPFYSVTFVDFHLVTQSGTPTGTVMASRSLAVPGTSTPLPHPDLLGIFPEKVSEDAACWAVIEAAYRKYASNSPSPFAPNQVQGTGSPTVNGKLVGIKHQSQSSRSLAVSDTSSAAPVISGDTADIDPATGLFTFPNLVFLTPGPVTLQFVSAGFQTLTLGTTTVLGPPVSVAATSGTPQSALVNATFATQLQVVVTDSAGDLLPNVNVTFTAPASGASGLFGGATSVTVSTDSNGLASAAITANATAGGPYTVTATVAGVATAANFLLTNLPGSVNVTLQTSPANLMISLDGGAFAATPLVASLVSGSQHTIATQATQPGAAGSQYAFLNWSDGLALSHGITVPGAPATFTATFKTQFQLTTAVSPSGAGTVTPASGVFSDAGAVVQLTATANAGFQFARWDPLESTCRHASLSIL